MDWPAKDPDEVLDYKLDWSARLASGDTIASSAWVVPNGIAQDSATSDDTTATIWLSGGEAGRSYAIQCRVTTAQGRTHDQTVRLPVRTK